MKIPWKIYKYAIYRNKKTNLEEEISNYSHDLNYKI